MLKYHDYDATEYTLIPQVRSNPRAQQVCVKEDKSDVDQCDESEWQMVSVRNRAKKCWVPGHCHMKSVPHCAEVDFGELDEQGQGCCR